MALGIRWPSIGASASASASVLPLSTQDLISFRIDWFEIFAAQGTLKSLRANSDQPLSGKFGADLKFPILSEVRFLAPLSPPPVPTAS